MPARPGYPTQKAAAPGTPAPRGIQLARHAATPPVTPPPPCQPGRRRAGSERPPALLRPVPAVGAAGAVVADGAPEASPVVVLEAEPHRLRLPFEGASRALDERRPRWRDLRARRKDGAAGFLGGRDDFAQHAGLVVAEDPVDGR